MILLLFFNLFTHDTCPTSWQTVKMNIIYKQSNGLVWEASYLEMLNECSSVTRAAIGNYNSVFVKTYENLK